MTMAHAPIKDVPLCVAIGRTNRKSTEMAALAAETQSSDLPGNRPPRDGAKQWGV